jgi:hypothetical protein
MRNRDLTIAEHGPEYCGTGPDFLLKQKLNRESELNELNLDGGEKYLDILRSWSLHCLKGNKRCGSRNYTWKGYTVEPIDISGT